MKSFLSFYFEQLKSINIAMPIIHFRAAEIPFYIKIHVGFQTQLMETTNKNPTVNKIDWYADI